MFHRANLNYTLPARKPGSFGLSLPGQVAEWVTTTWFRFSVFLIWVPTAAAILMSSYSAIQKVGLLLVSPVAAAFYVALLRVILFALLFVPKIGPIFGWLRVLYYAAFSRLVCQPAPVITTPLWFGRSRP
jgi:hypothetical protein